jgi:hypothetical protein
MSKKNPHWGPTLDDYLKDEGILEEVKIEVARRLKQERDETGETQRPEATLTARSKIARKVRKRV